MTERSRQYRALNRRAPTAMYDDNPRKEYTVTASLVGAVEKKAIGMVFPRGGIGKGLPYIPDGWGVTLACPNLTLASFLTSAVVGPPAPIYALAYRRSSYPRGRAGRWVAARRGEPSDTGHCFAVMQRVSNRPWAARMALLTVGCTTRSIRFIICAI